jgi:predicted nucleic acid-binding protein
VIVYADTSGLVKLLLLERGRDEMVAAKQQASVLICAAIGYVELRAALAAAIRDGRIPHSERPRLLGQVERTWAEVTEIALDATLLREAGELAEQMGLRAYDAVHLAALRAAGTVAEIHFACWDAALRRAAGGLGYPLIPLAL